MRLNLRFNFDYVKSIRGEEPLKTIVKKKSVKFQNVTQLQYIWFVFLNNGILAVFVLLVKMLLLVKLVFLIILRKKIPLWAIVRIYFIILRVILRFDHKNIEGVMISDLGEIIEMLIPVLPEQKAHVQIL